ncbi:MAG: response regulator transcription factor [Gemmatimonadota bacterium]
MTRVLVVEDNERLAQGLVANLEVEGYEARFVTELARARGEVADFEPHLVILDLMLPDGNGFDFLRSLRDEGHDVPVMILSARDQEIDKVQGFRWGADDYVTKPFGLMELVERVKAILRRGSALAPDEDRRRRLVFGSVEVDVDARAVRKSGSEVHLSPRAFDLLVALLERDGSVASRLELLRDVWGHRGAVQTRTVDAHVAELRRALEDDPADPRHIVTVWKAGYRLIR